MGDGQLRNGFKTNRVVVVLTSKMQTRRITGMISRCDAKLQRLGQTGADHRAWSRVRRPGLWLMKPFPTSISSTCGPGSSARRAKPGSTRRPLRPAWRRSTYRDTIAGMSSTGPRSSPEFGLGARDGVPIVGPHAVRRSTPPHRPFVHPVTGSSPPGSAGSRPECVCTLRDVVGTRRWRQVTS
jgi:hypothetical protein